ncbi:hypothetical protein tb265_08070 [Gemmatimonadetes bacterium T265]|nr:hypothetical protein tb265_08070 [Gemmatimonadetes bacterium T265]
MSRGKHARAANIALSLRDRGMRVPTLLARRNAVVPDRAVARATTVPLPSAPRSRALRARPMPSRDVPAAYPAAVEFFSQAPTLPTTDG